MATQTTPFVGGFVADTAHSSFGFSIRHMGVSAFRGTLEDVEADLVPGDDSLRLEGRARVESISVQTPPELRAHLLGPEFFDAENHPEVVFRSTRIELADDGRTTVDGELTIRGVTRPVTATGTWVSPVETAGGLRAALELATTFDRREFGMDWQMEAPNGGLALDWDVTITAHLELLPEAE